MIQVIEHFRAAIQHDQQRAQAISSIVELLGGTLPDLCRLVRMLALQDDVDSVSDQELAEQFDELTDGDPTVPRMLDLFKPD